jgi:hypothetical protein
MGARAWDFLGARRNARIVIPALSDSTPAQHGGSLLPAAGKPPVRVLLAVGVVCFATLLLEVALTRIFSAMMYYHFTFLVISLALLGLGSSGVYVYVRSHRFAGADVERELGWNARRFGLATLLMLAFLVTYPVADSGVRAGNVPLTSGVVLRLLLLVSLTVLSFFFAGMVVSLAVAAYRSHINNVYAYDLFGAACAAVLAGQLLRLVGGPPVVVLTAVAACAASALFLGRGGSRWLPAGGSAALFVASLATPLFALPSVKAEAGEQLFEGWNAFSRVTVMALRDEIREIQIDAAAATRISSLAATEDWKDSVSALGFALHQGRSADVLIIGPGGGMDVAHALRAGAASVTAAEINPLIANTIMRGRFLADTGGLYLDPRVRVAVEEGRSFVRRSRDRYDVIQASLVDTWASTSAGAFALTENSLYTVEAFDDYLGHLTDDGVVAMCRYYTGKDPETVRLTLLAAAALERRGVAPGQTRQHLYLAARKPLGVLLAKRLAFTTEELDRLDQLAREQDFEVALSPRSSGGSELQLLVDAGTASESVRGYALDISPPTDDRPFFFYFSRLRDVLDVSQQLSRRRLMNPALWVLAAITLSVTLLTVVFIFVPLLMYRLSALKSGGASAHLRRGIGLGYFALIGLAFMIVEIGLISKLVLFLGHPAHAFTTVVSAMLIGSATGALVSERWAGTRDGRLAFVAGVGSALAVVVAALVSDALRDAIVWPLAVRIAAGFVAAGLLGLLLGVMLPTGVRILSKSDPQLVPWAWGLNGGTSVIATVTGTVAAIHVGFTPTLLGGAALYVLAGACGAWLARLTVDSSLPRSPAAG